MDTKKQLIVLIGVFYYFQFSLLAQQGPIKMFRHFDDFSYLLVNDTIERTYYEKLKYLPIGSNNTVQLSFGGEIREQYQYFKNSNFGDRPPNTEVDKNGHLWHRVMVHSDLRLGKHWRVFSQLSSTFAIGKTNILPEIDENQLSLHQAFIEYRIGEKASYFLRVGRQEYGYASKHFLSLREGPNARLSFDMAVGGYEGATYKLYSFIGRPSISRAGVFDDEYIGDYIWSAYIIRKLRKGNLDAFYFGYSSDANRYNYIQGKEDRHTLGFRYWIKQKMGLQINAEVAYQFGTFNDLTINAYSISLDIHHRSSLSNLTILPGVTFNLASGDQNENDGQLNTYNVLYSKTVFGLTLPIGAINILNFKPYLTISPNRKNRITLSNYIMWRVSSQDGTYTPGRKQIRPTLVLLFATKEKYIGNHLALEWAHQMTVNWSFILDVAYFFPGKYVNDTGNGEIITYLSARVNYKI